MNRILIGFLAFFTIFILGFSIYVFIITRDLPDVRQLENWKPPEASVIFDYQDKVYNELYIQKRYYVSIEKIPDYVKKAFIATEDKSFYSNPGIDILGILRAAVKNIIKGGAAEGGSTISQQLVKNLFLTPEKSISRKIKEIVLAIRLNKLYNKDKILEMYLNQIYLGQGSYGVEAAARTYFGKSVSKIDLCEAAMLAGLPKAPSKYNPYVNLDLAEKRKQIVLQRMLEEGYISQEEYQRCIEKPIKLSGIERFDNFNDYFTEVIRQWVIEKYGEEALSQGGLKIYTTIDTALQIYTQKRVQQWLEDLQNRVGFPKLSKEDIEYLKEKYDNQKVTPETIIKNYIYIAKIDRISKTKISFSIDQVNGEAFVKSASNLKPGDYIYVKYMENGYFKVLPFLESAVVSIDSKSGGIRVLIGGYEFKKSQFNRVFQSKRQPGSAIKPIIYMAALLNGYTQISYLEDKPIGFWDYSQNKEWVPKNYDNNYYGTVTLRKALAKSLNAATVYLLSQIDFDPVFSVASKVGIKQKLPRYYSLALGSVEITPIELANTFATFGNYGTRCEPFFIRKVVDKEGNILYQQEPRCEEVLPKPQSAVMVDLLRAVVLEGTAVKASSMSVPVAGKTGTTNDYADAWFAGFDPDLTTVVWVGYDKRKPIGKGMTGSEAALPLWIDIMNYANRGGIYKEFPKIEGTVYVPIDPITNKVSNQNCPGSYILFVEGTYPTVDCDGDPVDFSQLFSKPQEEQTPIENPENKPNEETNQKPQENQQEKNNSEKDTIIDILKNR